MKKHIANNKTIYSIIVSMMQSIILGVYLALYSNKIVEGDSFISAFYSLGQHNIFIIVFIALFIFQIYIAFLEERKKESDKEKLINDMLKAACNTLVYPNTKLHIRAIITICDYKKKKRKTVYSYNIESDPERTAIYDIDFGVTGDAIKKRIPIGEELPENHVGTYSRENGQYVDPDLKSVLAAPIFSIQKDEIIIGVLAFDSIEPMDKIKFNTRKSKEIAQMWADVLSHLL